ncbi:MAG: DUF1574 domain-containing protein [Prevotellaceae bacterium]|jgi:hypothetical protein|nr:DUF1574 domain-containing protein [Prevotellaceae bacterium]
MKSFIRQAFLFLLPIAVVVVIGEAVLRRISSDLSYKKEYLNAHASEIETLILGSSHSYFGIDPAYFSSNAFNAACVSQSPNYDFAILREYEQQLTQLKTIILPISYSTPWADLLQGGDSFRVTYYRTLFGIRFPDVSLKYNFYILSNTPKANMSRVLTYLKGNSVQCSPLGWMTTYHSSEAQDLEETGLTAAARHTRLHDALRQRIYEKNVDFVDSIIGIAERHDARVLLFTPPAYSTYRKHVDSEQLRVMQETAERWAARSTNCTYVDLFADPRFVAGDYYDADHLSEIGAKKLSLLLDSLATSHP